MNRNKLKTYAPEARRDFIRAVTDRASYYGLTAKKTEPVTIQGDVAIISGRAFPKKLADQRKRLEDRIKRQGFDQVMEAMAYTWFNRLVAIRFMELHGYLDHGYRVLSHSEGGATPEIVEQAEHVDLPGLDKQKVVCLKLEGTKEAELYRMLLIAQCNALHSAMPFLFELIDDETELLLPDNLLHSDSLIRTLVNEIPEEDWHEVEIIGWLYQFYISEKKDEVIGKVVKSEDIPAATQLFTPNWIVKYLVQNSLGRQWMATYPNSPLKTQMEYYVEPAEQTPEVQEQLKAITPESLNPEELTLLDPACGSGHILVEAYDLLKAIYQERGYRAKDIPRLILEKNLYGLEIDDRAAQLAAFALLMKARADDRRIFDSEAKPNILAFQDSLGISAADLTHALNSPINKDDVPKEYLFEEIQEEKDGLFSKRAMAEKGHVSQTDIACLLELFENAKTFGSLIQIPPKLAVKLPEIEKRLDDVLKFGDLTHASAHVLKPLLQQARLLARRYDAVVANPPYMGTRYCNPDLKAFISQNYDEEKGDLCVCFIRRGLTGISPMGRFGMVTMHSWMFLSSFAAFRLSVLRKNCIESMAHLGARAFSHISGEVVQVSAFVCRAFDSMEFRPVFLRLVDGEEATKQETLRNGGNRFASTALSDFARLPGSPLAYWASHAVRHAFERYERLGSQAQPRQGLASSDDGRFLRLWHEVSVQSCNFSAKSHEDAKASGKKWFPFLKGGEYRKWYGNLQHVINWHNEGEEVVDFAASLYGSPTRTIKNMPFYFRGGITWSLISGGAASFREFPTGCIIGHKGPGIFTDAENAGPLLLFLNSCATRRLLEVLSPTLGFEVGHLQNLPAHLPDGETEAIAAELVGIHRLDWNSHETSWGFEQLPLCNGRDCTVQASFERAAADRQRRISRARELEEQSNRLFIDAYGLQDELSPEVPDDQITLYQPDRAEDIRRLLSYAFGCMMGRYSLDKPGLVYAHCGNQGFDPGLHKTFQADDDGIIPLLEIDWGIRDDATNRLVEFVSVAWPKEHVEENLKFIADSLGPNNGEQPRETIRRYLVTGFYKHHLSMYKKRPIYWLFSSGKQRAFQCLVYLHRYNEGTLARIRTEYVIPLIGRVRSRIERLSQDIERAGSTSHRKTLQKEQDKLKAQLAELAPVEYRLEDREKKAGTGLTFDEKLRHYADQRIKLDLDDGVKVNYGKFGDLLAEVKAITGGSSDD